MKISRTYRLSQATLTAIEELQQMTGAASATEIIEIAVARWHGAESQKGEDEMLEVTVQFDAKAQRAPVQVILNNDNKLTPKTAIAARNVAAGLGANVYVTDGRKTYRVTGNRAHKV